MSLQDDEKRLAGEFSVRYIEDGQVVGLGTGSTAKFAIEALGLKVRQGLKIRGIPTSVRSRDLATQLGIPLTTFEEVQQIDVTIDGADEFDPKLNLIKGGGGALLREKIVAAASRRMVVIADSSKWVEALGRFALPVEVISFGFTATIRAIEQAFIASGCPGPMSLRYASSGHPFVTDSGHLLVDAALERIPDPADLADRLARIPGVVEHGLFIDLAHTAIIAGSGGVQFIEKR